ncbi:MAG: cell division protein FtsL [Oscillospiraceae bacterium]|nr:cell division protein FtsL [Oscillospiraceae bacterium]MCL2278087.1 cell division protein FtsL [Oscillospiraceae bacterium]
MSGNVKTLNRYNQTPAVPAQTVEAMMDAEAKRSPDSFRDRPDKVSKKRRVKRERAAVEIKAPSGISVLAFFGTILVAGLMILSILAQVNYNEVAIETARIRVEVRQLTETHRALSLAFESSINIREVERTARDELGMSRPDATQVITLSAVPRDRAFVVAPAYEYDQGGFIYFITTLFDYFR